jgi:O-antigen/teichoic acid export membrane protein
VALTFSFAFVTKFLVRSPTGDFRFWPLVMKGLMYQASIFFFLFLNRYSYYIFDERARVGLYSTACTLCESVLIIASAVAPVLLAHLSNSFKGGGRLCFLLIKLTFLFSLAGMFVLLILPESFYLMVLGTGFAGIKLLMLVYAPVVIMQGAVLLLTNYFTAMGLQKLTLYAFTPAVVLALFLTPLLVHTYGLAGAAISANCCFFLVLCCLSFLFFSREKGQWPILINSYDLAWLKEIYFHKENAKD